MFKKILIERKISRLNKVAQEHLDNFNYHYRLVEKTSNEKQKNIHQKYLVERLTKLEEVNKRISFLEAS